MNCSARRWPCPIADRNGIVGVAVFDGRVTGEPLANAELELIFHLLEQVGLALRNIWLHDQIAGNNEMMTDVLRELSSACIVVGQRPEGAAREQVRAAGISAGKTSAPANWNSATCRRRSARKFTRC